MLIRPEQNRIADSPTTVLVVDDTAASRLVVGKTLVALGFNPIMACNGHSALLQVYDLLPDAIVTDLEMPGMDGEELIFNLRASLHLRVRDIPIIVSTSKIDRGTLARLDCLGVEAVVPKPIDVRDLSEKALQFFRVD